MQLELIDREESRRISVTAWISRWKLDYFGWQNKSLELIWFNNLSGIKMLTVEFVRDENDN